MKPTTLFYLLLVLLSFSISCKKDEKEKDLCEGVSCVNGGNCLNGNCNCVNGYTGTNCEIAPNPCANVTCQNNGVPTASGSNCSCVCQVGYEGTACQTLVRTKFLGSFSVNETCTSGTDAYSIIISASNSGDLFVTISNFYNAGLFINGEVNSSGGITIPNQPIGTFTISGNISKTGVVNFTLSDGTVTETCSFNISL